VLRDDSLARAVYSEAAGIGRALPAAVAVPASAEDVAALVRWARSAGIALTPRGSGSGMAGGAIGDGVVVDVSRLNAIESVKVAERRVRVGPGALRAAVNDAAERSGLRFPVNPSSGAFCTIGGMAATNAAGAHSLRLGAMREWVTALDCVFDDGSRATVRRGEATYVTSAIRAIQRFLDGPAKRIRAAVPRTLSHPGVRKESSGYGLAPYARSGELVDLLVGSEGTLAIFVGVELALAQRAVATSSVLAAFQSLDDAVFGAALARDAGASACELLDRTFLEVAAASGPLAVSADSEAALLIEFEELVAAGDEAVTPTGRVYRSGNSEETNHSRAARAAAQLLAAALSRAGASEVRVALDHATEAELWTLRHAASPILSRLDPSLKSMQFIEDACVPPERLAGYVRGVRNALQARGMRGVIFGHAGDAHVHVNPLVDVSRVGWRQDVASLLDEVTTLVASMGGTLTGEHGDGRLRAPLLERTWPPETIALFAEIKHAFDPRGIFNPGVKVPLAGQTPLGAIKYDPGLSALPPLARTALDAIERDRAWHRFRLSLLGEPG